MPDVAQVRTHLHQQGPRGIVDAVEPRDVQDRRLEIVAVTRDGPDDLLGTGEQQIAVNLVDAHAVVGVVDGPDGRPGFA